MRKASSETITKLQAKLGIASGEAKFSFRQSYKLALCGALEELHVKLIRNLQAKLQLASSKASILAF